VWRNHSFVAGGTGDTQSIKGDVPNQLLPMCPGQVVGDRARHSGSAELVGNGLGARFGLALKLAQDELPVAYVLDDAWRHAVQTDETQSAHDLPSRKQAREGFLVSQAVLEREHRSAGADQGRQQFGKRLVGSGLEPDENHVSGTDLEIAFGAVDQDALTPHGFIIRAQQEMDLVPGARQIGAVEAPNRPAANDSDFHKTTE
jgi:hypothetical protein